MKKDIEKEVLDATKLVEMSKGLKADFTEVSKHETGKGNKFNHHLRTIMRKEIKRSRKNRPE